MHAPFTTGESDLYGVRLMFAIHSDCYVPVKFWTRKFSECAMTSSGALSQDLLFGNFLFDAIPVFRFLTSTDLVAQLR